MLPLAPVLLQPHPRPLTQRILKPKPADTGSVLIVELEAEEYAGSGLIVELRAEEAAGSVFMSVIEAEEEAGSMIMAEFEAEAKEEVESVLWST